jgi:Xaa-Pro dipeptidase
VVSNGRCGYPEGLASTDPGRANVFPAEEHRDFLVPAEEVARRIGAIQRRMQDLDVAHLWIDHLVDRLYLSGSSQNGVVLVPAEGQAKYFVRKSLQRATAESPLDVQPHPGRRELAATLRGATPDGSRIGLSMDVMPASTYLWLVESVTAREFVDISATLRRLRATKSPWEIDQIRTASDQITTLYGEIGAHICPGITELELTGTVEGRLRQLGHGGTVRLRRPGADISMGTVVSGRSGRYPTNFDGPVGAPGPTPASSGGAGWKRLAAGDTVMLDIVTSHNGYHADTTRTFFLGAQPPESTSAAHEFCREILSRIESRLRPGAVCSKIYRETAADAAKLGEPEGFMGFGENRVRFFGHGVGLELDELPVIADKIDLEIEAGMVVAVEPKAFGTESGPVGIEDIYVVTESGCKRLCPVPHDILCV